MTVETLQQYGLEQLDDDEIAAFLDAQSLGVLGLPFDEAPYLIPLSYAFDGDASLYFTYVLGGDSRKERLTDAAERAQFLVYTADTMFSWESVLLEGTIEKVPPDEWDHLGDRLADVWRPDLFDSITDSERVSVYEFEIAERSGIRHTGLPPELE